MTVLDVESPHPVVGRAGRAHAAHVSYLAARVAARVARLNAFLNGADVGESVLDSAAVVDLRDTAATLFDVANG